MKKGLIIVIVLITNFLKGQCSWTSSVTSSNGSFTLTCTNASLNFQAVHTCTNNVIYSWIGPGLTANTSSININQPGSYSVSITDVVTSCTSLQTFSVLTNTIAPVFTLFANTYTATCLSYPNFTAVAITPSTNILFDWYTSLNPLIPVNSSSLSPSLFTPGSTGGYTIVATDLVTGCSSGQTFTVYSNIGFPTFSVSSNTGYSIGCTPSSTLTVTNVSLTTMNATASYSFMLPGNSTSFPIQGGLILSLTPSIAATSPGNYTVVVQDNSNFCQTAFAVGILQSSVNISFTHTVTSNGQVSFASNSTGTNSGTSYVWDFGDGATGSGISATHTYSNGGLHNVVLQTSNPNCYSASGSVNVNTIPCNAISTFTLLYSGTPQYWFASPSYYGNIISAVWDWGDGSSTNSLYPSHTYSTAGLYNICLSVTVSCANSSTTCANYNIYRNVEETQGMVHVTVLKQLPVSINEFIISNEELNISPNPANEIINVEYLPLNDESIVIRWFNGRGQKMKEEDIVFKNKTASINVSELPAGLYILSVRLKNNNTINKRVVISH